MQKKQHHQTFKPKYPIRIKPCDVRCSSWDAECPPFANIFLSRLGERYYG